MFFLVGNENFEKNSFHGFSRGNTGLLYELSGRIISLCVVSMIDWLP